MTTETRARVGGRWATIHQEGERAAFGEAPRDGLAHSAQFTILRKLFQQDGRVRQFVKRALDLACASTFLVLLSPVFLSIAFTLTLHLRRTPLFLHERVGRGGELFNCLKFRTMRAPKSGEEAELLPSFKAGVDSRTTALTRLLRKTSLDELPQLLNVLRGEMSLVGPRPMVVDEVRLHFGELAPLLLAAKPGMTGLWTVSGRSHVDYPERTLIELKYATTASFWLDVRILAKTAFAVVSRNGAL